MRSQLGREGLGAQTLPLQPPRWIVCTKSDRHPLLPSPRASQPGPRGGLLPASACGGQFPTLVGGGWVPTSIRGGLASALMPSRGSSCQGPSLGRPMWMRSSTWSGYGSVRHQLPLEAWAGAELAQLRQLPMVVAAEPHPSHEITEAF